MNRSALAALVTLSLASGLFAQTPAPQQSSDSQTAVPTIRAESNEVNLDMVFHDKKGKPIHDIRPEEIHVFENGVEQQLSSIRYLEGTGVPTELSRKPTSSGAIPVDPARELRFVTLVFEGLDQDGKRFFRQALQDLLSQSPEQNLYFSILVIDEKLNMIQSFTNDRATLLKSVDKSTMWSFPQYLKNTDEIKSELRRTLTQGESDAQSGASGDASAPPSITASAGGGPSASQVQGGVSWRMAKMQFDMIEQADSADRESGARGTIDALLALVRAQSELPGRKVVVYFNPWLFIPESAKEQYSYMVGAANRANITFYTVDPKGLVTWSQGSGGRAQLAGATGEIMRQQLSGGVGEVSTAQARAGEDAENGLRSNPLLWLRDLAQQTGGQTIAETNDLKAPMKSVMEDVRSYYEATYNPHLTVLDGKFRQISVRVDRPGIVVNTRSGYFALPKTGSGQQIYAYEVPMMSALSAAAPSVDVNFETAAERFNEHGPKIEYMVTLEAPLKGITFAPQPDGKNALVDVPLLALIRDSSGEVVEKFSKDFAVVVPVASMNGYKEGNLVQTFRTELAPGSYTLESVMMDRKGNKLGVKKSPLIVPNPTDKLAISDVVVVLRTESMKGDQMLDPFYFPGGKVVPTLNNALKGGPGKILPFYFDVYPDAGVKDAPKLTMAFYKEGQYLGSAEAPLPSVQKDGRIPYIADLPADKFTPGSYEIRLGVTQGASTVEQKVDFQVN